MLPFDWRQRDDYYIEHVSHLWRITKTFVREVPAYTLWKARPIKEAGPLQNNPYNKTGYYWEIVSVPRETIKDCIMQWREFYDCST